MIHAIYWYMYSNCGCRESLIAFYEILFSSCICKVISCFMSYFLAFIFSVNTSKYKYSKLTCYSALFENLAQLQLSTFTFGETTPTIQHIKAFELTDGPPFGRRPIAWSSIWSPPQGLENMSSYQVVLELDMQSNLEDFLMVFLAKVGSGRCGKKMWMDSKKEVYIVMNVHKYCKVEIQYWYGISNIW